MPYCKKCGAEVPEEALYCPKCGTPVKPVTPAAELVLAGWGERFVALLMDVIILGAIILSIRWFLNLPEWTWTRMLPWYVRWVPFVDLGLSNIIHFIYWTFMEGIYGQSIGKMITRIQVTRVNGEPINVTHAAIESLGKAFLFLIDLIIGLIFYSRKRQRLFNYISNTIVIVKTSR
ncbi:MAG: RDD family protein [Candidatus Bathyarchaeia archaeon]